MTVRSTPRVNRMVPLGMRNTARLAFLFLLTLAVTTTPLLASGEKGAALSGQVVDEKTGEPLAGCRIEVEGTNVLIFTDLDGAFTMPKLKPGKYRLRVSMVSYEDLTTSTISLSAGQQADLSLQLLTFQD